MNMGLAFAPVPFGLLIAQFLSNMIFLEEDTYFTKVDVVREKIKWLNVALACMNALVLVLTIRGMPDTSNRGSFTQVKRWLKTCAFWANVIQVAAFVISFFILVPQWNYICNQFFFTYNQAHSFMIFFATGATWAALMSD